MSKFKSYPEYKDSGVAWLGWVPEDWDIKYLKWALTKNEGGVWGDEPTQEKYSTVVLRSTDQTINGHWKIINPARRKLSAIERRSALLEEGDLLVTKSSGSALHIGKTTIVTRKIAKLGYCYGNFMQRLRVSSGTSPRFVWYFLNNGISRKQLNLLSNTTTGLANLTSSMLGIIIISLPSYSEQRQIVKFLDYETARMDELIAEQKRLIELLKEKRQAVISHAVTKGLESDAPMKDSGIEWLGEVPEHWRIKAHKYVFELNPKKSQYMGPMDISCSFVPMEKLKLGTIVLDEKRLISQVFDGYTFFSDDDVLQAKVTPCFENKNMALAQDLVNGVGFGSSEINVFRTMGNITPEFLFYRLQEDSFMAFCVANMQGAGGLKRVPSDVLLNSQIALPPKIEQEKIVKFLDNETRKIDALIQEAEKAIDLMNERRSALISAAVTGKIDVRDWQPEKEQVEALAS